MDIGAIIGGVVENIAGVAGIISNPVESVQAIAIGAVGVFLGVPVLDAVFKYIDDAIIWLDDYVIDKVPFKAAKDFFQGKLIDRLEKRIKRYQDIVSKISD